jgi:hypothetical protein
MFSKFSSCKIVISSRLGILPFWPLCVATLTLGSQPKQGVTRLQAKREAQESHSLGSQPKQGVTRLQAKREAQESHFSCSRECERMWGNEPSHSQVNSHCGSWTPKWTPKSSERSCKGQNSYVQRVLYIIGKVLKLTCLNWAHMSHLDI